MKMYKDKKIICLFLAPAVIGLAVFVYWPLLQTIVSSFYRWAAYSSTRTFVGVQNFVQVFTDQNPGIWHILKNNTLYALISVVFQVFFAMVLAACLEESFMRRFQGFFRTVLFVPSVISMTVIGLLWQALFNPNNGLVNALIFALGYQGDAPLWFGDSQKAIYVAIFVSQWSSVGYCMLINLIGIQKIPPELYEQARIDGAGRIKSFFRITLPLARESMLVTAIITVLGSYKLFTEIFVMTGGGPGRSTEVLATAMYRAAFLNDEMGVASVYAIIIFVITFALAALELGVGRSGSGEEG